MTRIPIDLKVLCCNGQDLRLHRTRILPQHDEEFLFLEISKALAGILLEVQPFWQPFYLSETCLVKSEAIMLCNLMEWIHLYHLQTEYSDEQNSSSKHNQPPTDLICFQHFSEKFQSE